MSPTLRSVIGWWQLVCGIAGVSMLMLMRFDIPAGSLAIIEQYYGMLNIYLGGAFFSLAAHAGYRLIRARPGAVGLALACQAPQMATFAFLGGPHVRMTAGPILGATLTDSTFSFNAGFNVSFFLGTMVQGPQFQVSVNLLAIVWTLVLAKAWLGESEVAPPPPPGTLLGSSAAETGGHSSSEKESPRNQS